MAKAKDKRDIYYRLAKEEGWRARSAYKLMHIDDKYHILKDVKKVVDLCAAPGSWSQVLARRLWKDNTEDVKIIAVDLQAMAPIQGVTQIQGDITKLSTAEAITAHFGEEKADLVVCDGAPDVTGVHELDEQNQSYLLVAALSITTHVLKPGGTFVAKIFRAGDTTLLRSQLQIFFKVLFIEKPPSSRDSSVESFVICRDYSPPKGYIPQMINPMVDQIQTLLDATDSEVNHEIIPFIFCGDLRNMKSELLSCRDNEETGLPEFSYNGIVEPYCVLEFKEMREQFDECLKRLPFKPTIENLIYHGDENYKKYLEQCKVPRKDSHEDSDPVSEDGIFGEDHEQGKPMKQDGGRSSSADHQLFSSTDQESNTLNELVHDLKAL